MEKAIICDLDGTLFDCTWRRNMLPNFDNFNANHIYDDVKHATLEILNRFKNDYKIIFVSGRNERFRLTTEQQLNKYLDNYLLFMRKDGDFRGDEVIKEEFYINEIKNNFDVFFVLDDRTKVVDMWRHKLNLTCFQVADGDF